MSWDEPLPSVCAEDGKGGCKKHPPTIRLIPGAYDTAAWLLDEHCPGLRTSWPALQYGYLSGIHPHAGAAYAWLIDPRGSNKHRADALRRIRAAEKKRYKEMKR